MNGIKTIGITGGIGSGKSYVSAILQEKFGIPVYDCDKEAKRLTASNEEIRQRLIALVGPEVFDGNKLNKQLLADYLFAQIRARMKMQRPELHRLQADFIIDNNQTDYSQLHNQLEKLLTLNS